MNIFEKEFKRRIEREISIKGTGEIIGSELKRRRLQSNETLETLSEDICSTSYLCKIERSSINPNKQYLYEICKKLDIPKNQLDYLMDLGSLLRDSLKCLLNNDAITINKIVLNGIGFENYRYQLLILIKHLINKDYVQVNELRNDLFKLVSTMQDYDLIVFAIINAFEDYYEGYYKEAIEDVKDVFKISTDVTVRVLATMIIFKACLKLNRKDSTYYYFILKNMLIDNNMHSFLEYYTYLFLINMLKNGCYSTYEEIKPTITNEKYINTLDILDSFYKKDFSKLKSINKEASVYASFIRRIHFKDEYIFEDIRSFNSDYTIDDYDPLIIEYLLCQDDQERIDFIKDVVFTRLSITNDEYHKQFFMNEIIQLPWPNKGKNIKSIFNYLYGGGIYGNFTM